MGKLMVGDYLPVEEFNSTLQDDARVSLTYHLDLGRFAGDHHFLAFVSRSDQKTEYKHTFETNVAPNRPDPSRYYTGINFSGRSTYIEPFSSNLSLHGVPDPWTNPLPSGALYGDPQYGFEDGWVQDNWTREDNRIDSVALAAQSSFFDNSLFTTLGGRRDRALVYQSNFAATAEGVALPPTLHGAPDIDQSANTYTIGAVYRFPFAKWVSVFANKSTNFQQQNGALLFNDQHQQMEVGPLRGLGKDAGLKFDLAQDRIIATVDYFQVDQNNLASGFNGAIPFYIQSIWDAILNQGPGDLKDSNQPNGHNPSGGDTVSAKATGVELEVTANLTKEWRLSLNVTKANNVTGNVDSAISGYVNAHLAEWEAHSSLFINNATYGLLPTGGTTPTVADSITEIQRDLAQDKTLDGGMQPNLRPWNANLFTAYSMSHGAFKNFTIGGGVNYRGAEVLYDDPTTHTNIMGGAYYVVNGMLAYQFKLGKTGVKLQFNVDNLLDNKKKQVLAGGLSPSTINGAQVGPQTLAEYTYYLLPTSYSLSARIAF
jgi:TonB dependent receptor